MSKKFKNTLGSIFTGVCIVAYMMITIILNNKVNSTVSVAWLFGVPLMVLIINKIDDYKGGD